MAPLRYENQMESLRAMRCTRVERVALDDGTRGQDSPSAPGSTIELAVTHLPLSLYYKGAWHPVFPIRSPSGDRGEKAGVAVPVSADL
jgi:hypothetical protein